MTFRLGALGHVGLVGIGAMACLLEASPAFAAASSEERIAVIVGTNLGDPNEEPLRYAESDARRFRDVLVSLGDTTPERAILLVGARGTQVLQAVREAQGRAAELKAAGKRVSMIFYYSGHGSETHLHLRGERLSHVDLRIALSQVPSDLHVVVVDACRTAEKDKGVRGAPSFDVEIVPNLPVGTVELWASARGQAAQESDELGGSVFTHFLTSGLRGGADADRDGTVTLAELYSYAYRRTRLRTTVADAAQHPVIDAQLQGAGEVVLSRPGRGTASITISGGADRYVVFTAPSASVVGELRGDRPARLAVPAGKFLVLRLRGGQSAIAMVDLSLGGSQELLEGDFQSVSREEFVARGGAFDLRPWRVEAMGGTDIALRGPEHAAVRAGLGVSRGFGGLRATVHGGFIGGRIDAGQFGGRADGVFATVDGSYRMNGEPWGLALGVGVEGRFVWQTLERADSDRLAAAGFASTVEQSYGAIGPRAFAQVELGLGANWAALGTASFAALLRNESPEGESAIALSPTISANLGVGYAF